MLSESFSTLRDLGRLQEIASVLIHYGFGEMLMRLGVRQVLEKAGRKLRWKYAAEQARLEMPQRVRMALEEMGPTFIKLGQIMGTRVDLFPPDWIRELEKLQRRVPPVHFDSLRRELESDLGAPVERMFARFDFRPLAAASIAQVHRARLHDGTEVVVKIRRPGIQRVVDADLRLMDKLAKLLEFEFPELENFHPREIVRQFGLSIHREMNFVNECRNTDRMGDLFRDDPSIVIPRIYWDYVNERVAVQDYIEGVTGLDPGAVEAAGLDRRVLAAVGARAVLRMILVEGFFHADPHDGNLLYLPGNRIAFIDFGMTGRLSATRRNQVVNLLYGIIEQDAPGTADVLLDWSGASDVDPDRLIVDMDNFIDSYHGAPLKQISLTDMLSDLTRLMRQHHLSLPSDLALLFRALVALDGMGRQNDPDFDIFTETAPFLEQVLKARYEPRALAVRGWRNVAQLVEIFASMPAELRRLLRSAHKGTLTFNIDLSRLDYFGWQLERAASWLAIGLVTAALIVSSSILMTIAGGPTPFSLIGFVAASGGVLWLFFSIWKISRARRRKM
ncbi:MAG TPA: AarF/UbiB family protein [Methylococcaceae bacterium]|nr:AarF/UbiB family protein [Methylococcaceae bacterium]